MRRRLALVVLVALLLAGCGSSIDEPSASGGSADPKQPPPTSTASAVEPRGFAGAFSSVDSLQRCKASRNAVVCASSASQQRVRLGQGAASYLGETAVGYPAAAPLDFGESIRTASGIECVSSSRGIECRRGGHGFVIGDETAIVHRGSEERRYEAGTATPVPDAPAPPADLDYPPVPEDYDEPIIPEDDGCDPNYEGACIPLDTGDLDCPQIPETDFDSVGSDPHGFDGDYDGVACESY